MSQFNQYPHKRDYDNKPTQPVWFNIVARPDTKVNRDYKAKVEF